MRRAGAANFVIASQRIGAKRRPMREAIQATRATSKNWIASSQVLLAMTGVAG
jgi:hypothetical protein